MIIIPSTHIPSSLAHTLTYSIRGCFGAIRDDIKVVQLGTGAGNSADWGWSCSHLGYSHWTPGIRGGGTTTTTQHAIVVIGMRGSAPGIGPSNSIIVVVVVVVIIIQLVQ